MKNKIVWPPLGLQQVENSVEHLKATLSHHHCRQTMSHFYEGRCEELWLEHCQPLGRVFNTSYFRLHDVRFKATDLPPPCTQVRCRMGLTCQCPSQAVLLADCQSLELCLGLTSAKEAYVINETAVGDDLAYLGYELYKKPQVFLSDPLKLSVLVITMDNMVAFVREVPQKSSVRRYSRDLGEKDATESGYRARTQTLPVAKATIAKVPWQLPGIYPDPGEVNILKAKDLLPELEGEVEGVLVKSVTQCITECLAVTDSLRRCPALLGVVYDKTTHNKPSLVVTATLSLTGEEVNSRFQGSSAKEVYELGLVSLSELLDHGVSHLSLRCNSLISNELVTHQVQASPSLGPVPNSLFNSLRNFKQIQVENLSYCEN